MKILKYAFGSYINEIIEDMKKYSLKLVKMKIYDFELKAVKENDKIKIYLDDELLDIIKDK